MKVPNVRVVAAMKQKRNQPTQNRAVLWNYGTIITIYMGATRILLVMLVFTSYRTMELWNFKNVAFDPKFQVSCVARMLRKDA